MFLVKKCFNLLCFEKSVSFITHTYTIACDLYLMDWVLRCSGARVLGITRFRCHSGDYSDQADLQSRTHEHLFVLLRD